MEIRQEELAEVQAAFTLAGEVVECNRYGSGHINDTFCAVCKTEDGQQRYILQRMNHEIFKDTEGLMKNITGVTRFLRDRIVENGGDPNRETLNTVPTKDGQDYYKSSEGNFWRIYLFIEGATCYDVVKDPKDFYQSGKAFGHFQQLLADYPAKELTETIPHFHDTPFRLITFKKAIEEDICGRAASVQGEIQFILDREQDMHAAMDMLAAGELPLRVTHNDTKLNNIMIDDKTGEALCIIDLDTIMPGLSIFDFGDSIRFGANMAAEDEPDYTKAKISLPLFDIYAKGFLEGCAGRLTENEKKMLPMGAKLMTLECGMRFLTDYLQGDVYFHTAREGHNLDRCRTQLGLVADMEQHWDEMTAVVEKY